MGRRLERNLSCVILAAGLGTRMKSSLPKVLHPICGKPMLFYTLEAVRRLQTARTVVVVGKNSGPTMKAPGMPEGVVFAVQKEQKGTAHALIAALPSLRGSATVLVLNGDTPFVTPATLSAFLRMHKSTGNEVSVLSFIAEEPSAYGRITRNPLRIVEEKDAGASEKAVKEVNSGVYAIEADALTLVKSIKMNRKKGEYYLTDIVETAVSRGRRVGVFCIGREEEFLGVNSRRDLARANAIMRQRIVDPGSFLGSRGCLGQDRPGYRHLSRRLPRGRHPDRKKLLNISQCPDHAQRDTGGGNHQGFHGHRAFRHRGLRPGGTLCPAEARKPHS